MEASADLALLGRLLQAPNSVLGDEIGLILQSELRPSGYEEAPRNVVTFASTGGDGVHFSFLDTGGGIADTSPVVMTVPMAEWPNRVVGENLRHFLGIGLHSAYFVLEQLQYDFEDSLANLINRKWQQDLSDRAQAVLAEMAGALDLAAWTDFRRELAALERRYAHLLEMAA